LRRIRKAVKSSNGRQIDLSAAFYDLKVDFPDYTFEQAAKRLVPNGFGTGKSAEVLEKEARKFRLSEIVVIRR
jgi:hypothetical protein